MPILTSTAKEPSHSIAIIRMFNRKRAKGVDVSDSLEALKNKVAKAFPEANWIFDLKWDENGSQTVASGRPYKI